MHKINDGLSKWQRYRLKLKEKGIKNKHNCGSTPEYKQIYRLTYSGRALSLLHGYKASDIKHNRGECTLTKDWIINNIFNSKCVYCGEDDWLKLGCDRKQNDLPHTPDNVVCCCKDCNTKKGDKNFDEYIKQLGGSPTS